jgi:hypothetical protein
LLNNLQRTNETDQERYDYGGSEDEDKDDDDDDDDIDADNDDYNNDNDDDEDDISEPEQLNEVPTVPFQKVQLYFIYFLFN